jgi:histidinol-phosphatase (PHP family)
LKPEELERIYFDFLTTAKDLQAKYRDQIDLLIGIETDYVTPLDLERTLALLDSRQDIQYVVGSVHHVQGVSIDFDKSSFLRAVEHCNDNTTGSTMTLSSSSKLEMPGPRDPDFIPTDAQMNVFLERYLDAQYDMILHLEPEVIGHFDLCLLFSPAHKIHGADRWGVYKKVLRNIKAVVEYGGLFEANSAAFRKGWETSYPTKEILGVGLNMIVIWIPLT